MTNTHRSTRFVPRTVQAVLFPLALAICGAPADAQAPLKSPRFELALADGLGDRDCLRSAGDVDADGFDDVIASNRLAWNGTHSYAGVAEVRSGRDGALLWRARGAGSTQYGFAVSGAGDVDGDGFDDVVVTEKEVYVGTVGTHACWGRVWVHSGRTWSILPGPSVSALSIAAAAPGYAWAIGHSASGVGDLDGDGRDDFAIGAEVGSSGSPARGRVVVLSGRTGAVLHILDGGTPVGQADYFGNSVSGVGDLDADGVNDIAVGDVGGSLHGRVLVFSGRTGNLHRTISGTTALSALGHQVRDAGDVDGDGIHEILATTYWGLGALFDGATGAQRMSFAGLMADGVGDVDGDGHDDFIVGDPNYQIGGQYPGRATVYSGATYGQLYHFEGSQNDRLGRLACRAGDVNGDGFGDFMFSARPSTGSTGTLNVYLGGPWPVEFLRVHGNAAGDHLGCSVSGAGDVDADGFDDVLVGAYGDDTHGTDSGSARVVSGATGLPIHTWDGTAAGDLFGYSVSGAGDLDGDGFADVIVGAPGHDASGVGSHEGMARALSGRTGQPLHDFVGAAPGEGLGISVHGAGDVNGDGYDDVIVGSNVDSATVYSGRDHSVLRPLTGAAGSSFGRAVSGAGDVDRDGFADLIVGAWLDDTAFADAGLARVVSGRDGSTIWDFPGQAANERFGYSVAGAGDVDRDGFADLIVGSGATTGSQVARVFSGRTGNELYSFPVRGYPLAVAGAGDVNGDGYDDVAVGVPSPWGSSTGIVRVMSGFDGGVLIHQLEGGPGANDSFGISVDRAGDLDGDGFDEVIVGAYLADPNSLADSGSAFVYGFEQHRSTVLRPGIRRSYGAGCPGADGRLPRIGAFDRPAVGRSFDVTLGGGPLASASPAYLFIGTRISVRLGMLGLPACTWLADPIAQHVAIIDPAGMTVSTLGVPNDPALLRVELAFQWLVVDPNATHGLPVALSDGLRAVLGR